MFRSNSTKNGRTVDFIGKAGYTGKIIKNEMKNEIENEIENDTTDDRRQV